MKIFQTHLKTTKSLFSLIVILGFGIAILSSCGDDDEDTMAAGTLEINVQSLFNDSPLMLNTTNYPNVTTGEFIVEEFKIYFSNIKLRNTQTGIEYSVPESYHLITAVADGSPSLLVLENVPSGEYDKLEISIGIDEQKNLSLDNDGDLDPNNNMAWNWNAGYKFIKFDGRFSPEVGNELPLVFHIGLNDNYRIFSFDIPDYISVRTDESRDIKVNIEVSEFFKSPNTIDFNLINDLQAQPESLMIGENYEEGVLSLELGE